MVAGALSHIKVLDLSRVLAGPWCTQNLADLGAEVIKVERPKTGDDTRALGTALAEGRRGPRCARLELLASANRGKQSITVNIAVPEGQNIVRQIAARADVLIENYKVGDLKRYGLDYAVISKANPGIVYCSITGYGQHGPYAAKPVYGFVFQGLSAGS